MKNSLDVLKKIYKPYKYTIINSCTLLESTSGNVIVKKKGSTNIRELFNYLSSRSFNNFPKLLEDNRDEVNVFEYVEDVSMPVDQKASDLIDILSNLHNKTTYYKEVTADTFKEIYENVLSNIIYKEKFYNDLISDAEDNVFLSPSENLLLTNSYKIFDAIEFCKRELEEWYSMVSEKKKERVALIHNNLKLEHYIRNTNDYLISWDKATMDTPVLDLYTLYKNEALVINFSNILKKYLDVYPLKDHELKLFFILIVLPDEIALNKDEFNNVKDVRYLLDYIFKTEDLIRPYYSKQEKEQ